MGAADYSTPQAQSNLLASDQGLANLYGIPLNQVTPQLISQYQQIQAAKSGGFWDQVIMNKVMPAAAIGLATAGIGSAVGAAAGSSLGATGGAIVGGAAQGAAAGGLGATLSGGNIGKGLLVGGLEGGVGGALSGFTKPITAGLTNAGLPAGAAGALVKGGVGAGVGALGAGLTGGNVGSAALSGGIRGAVTPAVGNLIGSSTGLGSGFSNALAGAGVGAALGGILGSGSNTSGQGNGMANISPLMGANIPVGAGGGLGTANTQPIPGSSNGSAAPSSAYDFSSTGSTLASLLGPALGTAAGVYGAQNGAQAQTAGINAGIGTQQAAMGTINGLYTPQQTLGNQAFGALGSTLGINGQPANYSNFENMPGYQFAIDQGTQAINRAASASGNAYNPATNINIGKYVTGTAAQDYNTYVGQLMQTAGFGQNANQNLTQANLTTAGNVSQLQQNKGNAQASGVAGSAGAISSLLGKLPWGSLVGAAGSALGGGSGGSGGSALASRLLNGGGSAGVTPGSGPGSLNTPVSPGDISNLTAGSTDLSGYGLANQGGTLSGMTQPTSGYLDPSQLYGGGGMLGSTFGGSPDMSVPENPIPLDNSGNLDWLNYSGG